MTNLPFLRTDKAPECHFVVRQLKRIRSAVNPFSLPSLLHSLVAEVRQQLGGDRQHLGFHPVGFSDFILTIRGRLRREVRIFGLSPPIGFCHDDGQTS